MWSKCECITQQLSTTRKAKLLVYAISHCTSLVVKIDRVIEWKVKFATVAFARALPWLRQHVGVLKLSTVLLLERALESQNTTAGCKTTMTATSNPPNILVHLQNVGLVCWSIHAKLKPQPLTLAARLAEERKRYYYSAVDLEVAKKH